MASFTESVAKFEKLALRERVLAVLAVAVVLYFILDLVLLGPQQSELKRLRQLDQANQTELASLSKVLGEIANNPTKAVEVQAQERAKLEGLKKEIAEADAFLGQANAGNSQLGDLVRGLLAANSGLTLVSLKTLPVSVIEIDNAAAKSKDEKNTSQTPAADQKKIYRQGVEMGVKGNYLALLTYLRNLEKYPKRLFWSSAKLDVASYPDTVLKVTIYTLSDQPDAALR